MKKKIQVDAEEFGSDRFFCASSSGTEVLLSAQNLLGTTHTLVVQHCTLGCCKIILLCCKINICLGKAPC